jgi:hypothetical protein
MRRNAPAIAAEFSEVAVEHRVQPCRTARTSLAQEAQHSLVGSGVLRDVATWAAADDQGRGSDAA